MSNSSCCGIFTGAVYIDAGGCSDLEPVHEILARVIPSYQHGSRSQRQRRRHHHQHQYLHQLQQRPVGRVAPEPPRVQGGEPRKLMNLTHR